MALFTLDQHVAPYYRLVAFISVQTNGDTTRVTKKRCVFGISDKWGNLEGKRLLEDLDNDGRIILQWIIKK